MKKNWIWILLILLQITLIAVFKNNTMWVDNCYSNGFYLAISSIYRSLFSVVIFSVGDLLYIIVILWVIVHCVKLFRTKKTVFSTLNRLIKICFFLGKVSIVFLLFFNLLWGYNNYREPLSEKIEIDSNYTDSELIDISYVLLDKVTELQFSITKDSSKPVVIDYSIEKIFEDANLGYSQVHKLYPWIEHKHFALKKSLISTPLSYMGFGGYINPFTNEAQVNYKLPKIGMYVTASHEIAHQIGYASESEANFLGYLNAISQLDDKYQYSGYLYALRYCLQTLKVNELEEYDDIMGKINQGVCFNVMENELFWKSHKNPSNHLFKFLYGNFLKINNQREGIQSYNQYIGLLINYHKKHKL